MVRSKVTYLFQVVLDNNAKEVPRETAANISSFLWWGEHHTSFPLLALIARRVLAIPASSVQGKIPEFRVFF